MNEDDSNGADNNQADFESYLKRFRPAETSASIAETFYQAGWRAAVAPQRSSAGRSSRGRWAIFVSGAACGMLPLLILLISNQAGKESGVARSDASFAPRVQPRDVALNHIDVAARSDAKESEHSSQKVATVPSVFHVFAETFMPGSWFPRLQISEASMSSSSTLRFRPLTSDVMDLANIDQRSSASSKILTTTNAAVQSVDAREPLSARSSAMNDDLLRDLFL